MKIVLFSLLLPLLLTACSGSDSSAPAKEEENKVPPIINSKPGQGRIVVAGDSLAHGLGSTDYRLAPGGCIATHFPGGVDASSAVDGATTADLISRLPNALKRKPKLVFISSGGNDAIADYYYKVSIGELPPPANMAAAAAPAAAPVGTPTAAPTFVAYPSDTTLLEMNQVFTDLQATGALVVYLGLKPPMAGSERLALVTELAVSKGVLVVDGMDGLWTDATLMSDEFHPNDAGYQIMCDRIIATITPHYP